MPYADPAKRREQQRRYRQSEHGKEVRRRIRRAYLDRKRADSLPPPKPDPQPLTAALQNWR